jgi:hypothetical protein
MATHCTVETNGKECRWVRPGEVANQRTWMITMGTLDRGVDPDARDVSEAQMRKMAKKAREYMQAQSASGRPMKQEEADSVEAANGARDKGGTIAGIFLGVESDAAMWPDRRVGTTFTTNTKTKVLRDEIAVLEVGERAAKLLRHHRRRDRKWTSPKVVTVHIREVWDRDRWKFPNIAKGQEDAEWAELRYARAVRAEWTNLTRMYGRAIAHEKTSRPLTRTKARIADRLRALDSEMHWLEMARVPKSLGKPDTVVVTPIRDAGDMRRTRATADNPYGWSESQAKVYRLRVSEGMTLGQIAKARGTSRAAVAKLWREAREKVEQVVTPIQDGRTDEGEMTENEERQDRILTLVFRHGLDGWAATVAADDPAFYALFEPEDALAA